RWTCRSPLAFSVDQQSGLALQYLYRCLGEQQQQVELDVMVLQRVADFHRQGALPAIAVDPDQLLDGAVLPQYHGVARCQLQIQLFTEALEAGTDDNGGQVQLQLQRRAVAGLVLQQPGNITDLGVVEYQQGLAGNAATDIALADGRDLAVALGVSQGHVQLGYLENVDVGDGQLDEDAKNAGQQLGCPAHGDIGHLTESIPEAHAGQIQLRCR